MSDTKKEHILCHHCGDPIVRTKGVREEIYEQELAAQVHRSCSKEHEEILAKYKVRQEDYTSTLFEAMTQMLRLENTDAMKGFSKRIEEATKETNERFPNQAAMAQKAQPESQQQQPPQTIEVKRAPKRMKTKPKKKMEGDQ